MTLRATTTSRHRCRAMTLLELMVTIAIFGGLMAMLLTIFDSSLQSRATVNQHIDVIDRAYGAAEMVVRDLESLHAFDSRAYLIVETHEFGDTTGTSIAFPTATPIRVSQPFQEKPGLIEIAYLVGPDPDQEGRLRLFRRELEIETDTNAKEIRKADEGLVLLVSGLKEFRMEFLSADEVTASEEEDRDAEYADQWEGGFGTAALPVTIRLVMTAASPKDYQPEMTLQRTVRLPISNVSTEMLQEPLNSSLGIE